jgi:hypothetical protein
VKTFPRVVIDRCPQVLQIAAGSTPATARLNVFRAAMRVHFNQHHAAEEIVQPANAICKFCYVDLLGLALKISALAMGMLDCWHVRDIDIFNIAGATRRLVFRGDVFG